MISPEVIRLVSKFPKSSIECRNCDKPINNGGFFCNVKCANENLVKRNIRRVLEYNKTKTSQDIIYLVNDIINRIDTKQNRYAFIYLNHILRFYVNKTHEEDLE